MYQTGLLSVRDAKAMLPGISSSLLGLFQSQRHPACLEVLADCVEYFGRDADVSNLFSHMLYVVCSAAEPVMQVWVHVKLLTVRESMLPCPLFFSLCLGDSERFCIPPLWVVATLSLGSSLRAIPVDMIRIDNSIAADSGISSRKNHCRGRHQVAVKA